MAHQQASSLQIAGYENRDNYNKLDTREMAASISVNQKCHSVAGEVDGMFLRDTQSVTPAFQADILQ